MTKVSWSILCNANLLDIYCGIFVLLYYHHLSWALSGQVLLSYQPYHMSYLLCCIPLFEHVLLCYLQSLLSFLVCLVVSFGGGIASLYCSKKKDFGNGHSACLELACNVSYSRNKLDTTGIFFCTIKNELVQVKGTNLIQQIEKICMIVSQGINHVIDI